MRFEKKNTYQRKVDFMQDAISMNASSKSYHLTLIKPRVHRQPNIRFSLLKGWAGFGHMSHKPGFQFDRLNETLMRVPWASLTDLPSWPDDRIFNQVTKACTSVRFFFLFAIWCLSRFFPSYYAFFFSCRRLILFFGHATQTRFNIKELVRWNSMAIDGIGKSCRNSNYLTGESFNINLMDSGMSINYKH